MASVNTAARSEREKKLKGLLFFASNIETRVTSSARDITIVDELLAHVRVLPLPASTTVAAKQDELDRIGTGLWNLSTRLRRNEEPSGNVKEDVAQKNKVVPLLRVFAFLLLDTASGQAKRGRERNNCVRLMKVALKAARVCIDNGQLGEATKVLERAADYQEALGAMSGGMHDVECKLRDHMRIEYFAMRTTLAWQQGRMDVAEHMFAKCRQEYVILDPRAAENLADLFYEIGKDMLAKKKHDFAVTWLERAHDTLGEQDLEVLSPEAGELRLAIMQSTVQAYMKKDHPEAHSKAWEMMTLLETDYRDRERMTVCLLKLELLNAAVEFDTSQYYTVLLRLIHSVSLNEFNFKTIMHHIHRLKNHSDVTACKILEDLIDNRLIREENDSWIEKAVITRIWMGTTATAQENCLESLCYLLNNISKHSRQPLSAPATHAAQTLLWKRVEACYSQEQYAIAESWCNLCLCPIFEKAGELNKVKIARKIVLCAVSRQDYAAAREVFAKMSDTGRNESISRYLMYKAALKSMDDDMSTECLELIAQQSSKDATLLYACALEAQSSGNKWHAIDALQKVLEKYNYAAPAGVHLPALLRCTSRLLATELIKDGKLSVKAVDELCKVFEGGWKQAYASRRRLHNAEKAQEPFLASDLEWFSKNSYNLSLKHCADMQPKSLVSLLGSCIEFIKLLNDYDKQENDSGLPLRLMFCHFLTTCALATLARAEDNIQDCLQYYLQVRKHGQDFRRIATEQTETGKLGESAKADISEKHVQLVKLELEAALKLKDWDALDSLFEECFRDKESSQCGALADLVLVIYSSIVSDDPNAKIQTKILSVLQRIINATWHQSSNDIAKLSRWIRCLYHIALTFDESVSLKCLDQATQIAAATQGEANTYPSSELEWLATTSYNRAVDYYIQENDEKSRVWGERAIKIAQWADDGGKLRSILMQKYSSLTWDE